MSTTATSSGRRIIAALAATTLAAIGLAAVTQSSADGAVLAQKVNVSVSTGTGTVYTNSPVRADFTLANPATNTGNVDVFSIVIPGGVTGVSIGGASGPVGSVWREALLPCGTRTNCSKILLVYPASSPLSKSFLRPGQSMVASVLFTTGAKAGSLPFSFIGIGNGVFTAASTPSISVTLGDAANFLVDGDATVTAGLAGHYTFHTQNINDQDVPFPGGVVAFSLGHVDTPPKANATPKLTLTFNNVTSSYDFNPVDPAHPLTPWVEVPVPSSGAALGVYDLTLTLNQAGANSLSASAPTKKTGMKAMAVKAADAAIVAFIPADPINHVDPLKDASGNPDLTAGKNFKASFSLTDRFGNPALLTPDTVVLTAAGTVTPAGVLTVDTTSTTGPNYNDPNNILPGVINANWSKADPAVTFTLTLGSSKDSLKRQVVPVEVTTVIPATGGVVGTDGCNPLVSACGSATFPASASSFTASIGVNFCTGNDVYVNALGNTVPVCTTGQPQILSVTGEFGFTRAAPASSTSTCSGDPAVLDSCPRVPKYKTVTYYHYYDGADFDFDCIATSTAGCAVQSPTQDPQTANGCLSYCHMDDVNSTPSDNEVLTVTTARTVQVFDGWVDDKIAYPNGQAQASGVESAPWLPMPACIAGGLKLPAVADVPAGQSTITCLDKDSSASYVRADNTQNAPLTVIWRFVGDPRTHSPAA